jgi:hypothetical protein
VVDTEGGGLFVVKFRGAGQGARALVAELLVGGLAEVLGLPMPEMALIALDDAFGRAERDPEIQDILAGSRGLNVGHRYLEGALELDAASDSLDLELAARVVWLDALVSNIDRTARNPNLMWWQDSPWLIDHGAALYFHHAWSKVDAERARAPFTPIRDHVLLRLAGDIGEVDEELASLLTEDVLMQIVDAAPDELLMHSPPGVTPSFASAAESRSAYLAYFRARLEEPRDFASDAELARRQAREQTVVRQGYRR